MKGISGYSLLSLVRNALSYHENWQRAWRSPEPKRVYALVEAEKSALIVSTDGGRKWQKVNEEHNVADRHPDIVAKLTAVVVVPHL